MPYKSEAQRRKFHAMANRGEISAATVDEYDQASKGMSLPERVPQRPKTTTKKKTTGAQEPTKRKRRSLGVARVGSARTTGDRRR